MHTTTAATAGPARAIEYLRVSHDSSGRARSIDEQHADNVRTAEAHGWVLGDPYDDTGSASRYATKARAGYDRLVADLAAGRFDGDVLVLWEASRGSRRVAEWCELIERCEDQGVKIHVTSHQHSYDVSNARDRRTLLEDAVDSEYETAKLSSRVLRSMASNAADGRPHGRVPYGYRRRYDDRTGKLIEQIPEPAEAAVVRELYDRIATGHSLRSIAADFEQRGIRTRDTEKFPARPFTPAHLRDLATKRAYIGERVHTRDGVTTVVDGQWDGILARKTWHEVQRIISAPERRTTRPGRGIHLLSMIACCDVCSGPLAARNNRDGRGRAYHCHRRGCVRIDYDGLNELAEAAMLAYLARPDNVERLTAGDGNDTELDNVRAAIAEIQAELDDLADQVGAGELSATLAARAEPAIKRRLQAARDREAELATPSALRGLVKPGADVARRWDAAPMSAQRQAARLLLAPDVLGELRVTRSPSRGHKVAIDDRVVWRRS